MELRKRPWGGWDEGVTHCVTLVVAQSENSKMILPVVSFVFVDHQLRLCLFPAVSLSFVCRSGRGVPVPRGESAGQCLHGLQRLHLCLRADG